MTRLIVSTSLNMNNGTLLALDGSLGAHDATSLTMVDGQASGTYQGYFFYGPGGAVEGEITGITLLNGGTVRATFSDVHFDFGLLTGLAQSWPDVTPYRNLLRGEDTVHGGAGDDVLSGFKGADLVYGHGGDDALYARDFAAYFLTYGEYDEDTLIGGAGNDTLYGSSAMEPVAGSDYQTLWHGDWLIGGLGNDRLLASAGADALDGGLGDDVINGGAESDTAYFRGAAAAHVDLSRHGAQATGYGRDTLISIENLSSGQGNDHLTGSAGDNHLEGNGGNDRLEGGAGYDGLEGGAGNDTLLGGGQSDWFVGGAGNDLINGGGDIDALQFDGPGNARVDLTLTGAQATGFGQDRLVSIENIYGSDGNDRFRGNGAANQLGGGAGNDLLQGLGGKDYLWSSEGKDTLIGGAQDDQLSGGAGKDRLIGGGGDDVLTGDDYLYDARGEVVVDESGNQVRDTFADRFVFARGDGHDALVDFNNGLDRIEISSGANSFDDLTIVNDAGGALISFADVTIQLYDVRAAQLTAADFVFV